MDETLKIIGKQTKNASRQLMSVSTEQKNQFLTLLAEQLWQNRSTILAANQEDILAAQAKNLSAALIDRLMLNETRIQGMMADIRQLIDLPDPVAQILEHKVLPNGLKARRERVPLGVIAVIYEARPNVTIDISALALKAGNAVILRGGKETRLTNLALVMVIKQALKTLSLPEQAVMFIDDPDRRYVNDLVKMDQYVDLLIPRGGNNLQDFCKQEATMPVMTGGIGICHLFVDKSADFDRSINVIENAKVQRPSVCNALDTLLIHKEIAEQFLPPLVTRLRGLGVKLHLDEKAANIIPIDEHNGIFPVKEGDFDREWLSLTLGIKIVAEVKEAIMFIWEHSTFHSDGILSQDQQSITQFLQSVDSAAVYVNASTRFTDGAQLGLGGEVAVSTQKLHARGPVGLEALTSYRWILEGNYSVRE